MRQSFLLSRRKIGHEFHRACLQNSERKCDQNLTGAQDMSSTTAADGHADFWRTPLDIFDNGLQMNWNTGTIQLPPKNVYQPFITEVKMKRPFPFNLFVRSHPRDQGMHANQRRVCSMKAAHIT